MGNITVLIGSGGAADSTSVAHTTPYPHVVGTRARDASGNEFVYVDYTGTVFSEQPVLISSAFTAAVLPTTSARGLVGVAVTPGTSDNAGWVQIYGRAFVQLGLSGVSPSDAANGPTTLTSTQTIFTVPTSATTPAGIGYVSAAAAATSDQQFVIEGIFVATDVSLGDVSATTSATSHTGNRVAVFLNYPYVHETEITT